MIPEIGHFALILAVGVALYQIAGAALWRAAGRRGADAHRHHRRRAAAGADRCSSFLALTHAYVVSDFSVQNVFENSHSAKPLIYKISGVWGNHEGSMLLWVLILALYGSAVALFGQNLPMELRARVHRGAGLDRPRLPAVHRADVQPLPAHRPRRRSRAMA